jgi:hypothetical protein
MTKLFVPFVDDEDESRKQWDLFNKSVNGRYAYEYKIGIYSLRSQHNGKSILDRVGEPCSTNGQVVIAIIESSTMFSVITISLKDYSKSTFMVGKGNDVSVEYFES